MCVGGDVFFFFYLFIYFLLFYLFVVVEKKCSLVCTLHYQTCQLVRFSRISYGN